MIIEKQNHYIFFYLLYGFFFTTNRHMAYVSKNINGYKPYFSFLTKNINLQQ